ILKPVKELPGVFPESFIFFQPKDIVSGDFYWFERFGNLSMIAAADCTGHGVPGAFMSIIGCNLMSQAVNEYALTKPAVILNSLNKGLSKILHQRMDEYSVKDGMDIALCSIDMKKMTLEFAGAFNPLWLVRDGAVLEYAADKFPVGAFLGEEMRIFNNHEVPLQEGDTIYLFSDGYADQFGGPRGKKFKYKQLKELLLSINEKNMDEQREILRRRIEEWRGKLEQVDDILVIGVRV
ncbi:MAG TPA: SpoIIE family protein phosphatase, partial [Bacteroidia bacterium]